MRMAAKTTTTTAIILRNSNLKRRFYVLHNNNNNNNNIQWVPKKYDDKVTAGSTISATAKIMRRFSSSSSSSPSFKSCYQNKKVVDLRSDTVTLPSQAMIKTALTATVGDDVMGEDPTVLELEQLMAEKFGKDKGLFVPTGTMANLIALISHCDKTGSASEIIIGSNSHINLWEGGNASNLGGIHTRQINEDINSAQLDEEDILDCIRHGVDDHWPKTSLLCLENSHNMCGGVALPKIYFDQMGRLAHKHNMNVHVDGARIFNAAIAQEISVKNLCKSVDSISICLSKGLGAPLGSVLVGDDEFIRVAKSARKRCGGGMRQAGVVASMGLFAIQNNTERLVEDHVRAKRIGYALKQNGCYLPRNGQIDTNIVYFALPETTQLTSEEFVKRLKLEYGVNVTGGYSRGGKLFRIVTHMDVDDEDIDRTIEAIDSTLNSPV